MEEAWDALRHERQRCGMRVLDRSIGWSRKRASHSQQRSESAAAQTDRSTARSNLRRSTVRVHWKLSVATSYFYSTASSHLFFPSLLFSSLLVYSVNLFSSPLLQLSSLLLLFSSLAFLDSIYLPGLRARLQTGHLRVAHMSRTFSSSTLPKLP